MAKQIGALKLSGKFDDKIAVAQSKKKGRGYVKAASDKKMKNQSDQFKAETARTKLTNGLSSRINNIFKRAASYIKPSHFYRALNTRFRAEKSNERILLLDMLQDMEINEAYKLETLFSFPHLVAEEKPKELEVKLISDHHGDRNDHECYFVEILVLMWNKKNDEIKYDVQKSEWIPTTAPLPVKGSFIFKRPNETTDYLIACRCVVGNNNSSPEYLTQQGIKILAVGSYGKREKELLESKTKNKVYADTRKKPEPEEVRVKMSFGENSD